MGERTSRTQTYSPAYSPQSPPPPPPPRPPSCRLPSYAPPTLLCRPPPASRPVRAHPHPARSPGHGRSLVHIADHTRAPGADRARAPEADRARAPEAGRTRGPAGVARIGPGAGNPRPRTAGMAAQAGLTGTAMARSRAAPAAGARGTGSRRGLAVGGRADSGSDRGEFGCGRTGVGGTADSPGNMASR